jgi:hypothetical protein
MPTNFTYTHEDENGDLEDYEVTYTINKGSSGSREDPPSDDEIIYHSIKREGMEVAELNPTIFARIEHLIWEDLDNDGYEESTYDDWDYGYDDLH